MAQEGPKVVLSSRRNAHFRKYGSKRGPNVPNSGAPVEAKRPFSKVWLQEGPKRAKEVFKMAQDASKIAPIWPHEGPKRLRISPRGL